jgi:hypothetical protein
MSSSSRQLSAVTAVALLGLPVQAALAQRTEMAGEASLNEKLLLSEATIRGLTESLAVANGETELFKRKFDDMNERVEALGVGAPAGKETDVLRTRLIAAVRDLGILQKENEASRERLASLSEAVIGLLKTSQGIDPKCRLQVEESLRSATRFLGKDKSVPDGQPGLTEASVVDFKPDLSLIVANIGSLQGVRTGMPFQVWRGDRQVASVRVVDVRDSVSGAIVQSLSEHAGSVRTGDALRIDTTR